MRIRRILSTLLLCYFLLSLPALAVSHVEYDENTDYMTEMIACAEDGSDAAIRQGAMFEFQRNLKIRGMGLSYEETVFFREGRTGEEILADIYDYIKGHNRVYLGRYYITGYTISYADCGKIDGITASGIVASVGRTCASGKEFAFGTRLYIDGIGERTVEDRGGGVHNGHIDVLFATHDECYAATGWYDVWLIEE